METLIDIVTEGARRFDRRPALLIRPGFRTRVWRYRDLGEVVPRAARALSDAGVATGDRVVIWGVNRPEWGIGLLAVAHVGGVSVPLDVRHTVEFGRKVVAQTDARLVLASRQTMEGALALGLPVIAMESLPDLARGAQPLPPAMVSPDDLAEIVYTSGTTGDPKGAMLTHRNLVWCASTLSRVLGFGPDERLLSVLPLSHLFEQSLGFFCPLITGASVAYPVSRQPAVLMRTFRETRASMLLIVPQGLRLLDNAIGRRVDQAGRRATFERMLALGSRLPPVARRTLFRPVLGQLGGRLHTIGVGSSALDVDVARRWTSMGVDVLQGYGSTEMAPAISITTSGRNRLGTVGQVLPGVEVRLEPDGEILARGPSRFAGYWQNPEATKKAIDPDGWYHTGDLGRMSDDGMLTLLGRKKDMIALPDGQKVYPEDVEAVLALDERLRGAAVVGWPPGPGLRVHAVLVLDEATADPGAADPGTPSGQVLADAIVRDANARLGAHQQIRGVTIWPDEDLPRTHTLKVRKHEVLERLADMAAARDQVATTDQGHEVPSEEGLAAGRARGAQARPSGDASEPDPLTAIVASLAGLTPGSVGPTTRLSSDLGLDSLQRVELLGVIEEELGTYVDDDALAPDSTILELAGLVEAARGATQRVGAWRWPLHPLVRGAGLAIQLLIMGPFVRLCYRVSVSGLERLDGHDGPVLITPNHCLHTDNLIILSSLPARVRWKLSIAAAADTIYDGRIQGLLASFLANAFPLQREGGVRRSLEMLGHRLDRGFSILIYPEGKLTVGGPMQPFKPGVGLIAVEGALPVVPVKLHIRRMALMDQRRLPAPIRGEVHMSVGEPIRFEADTDPVTATTRLEQAMAAM